MAPVWVDVSWDCGVDLGRAALRWDILCRNIFAIFNGRMQTEESESAPPTRRSESMKKAWEKRRAAATMEAEWFASPVCLCGCGEGLTRHASAERQPLFRRGHDARLKSLARKVLRGDAEPAVIPEIARAMKSRLAFLLKDPELAKLF